MRTPATVVLFALVLPGSPALAADLAEMARRADSVAARGGGATEWGAAVEAWKELLAELEESSVLLEERLLRGYLEAMVHEGEALRPFELLPSSYLGLPAAEQLSSRPCGHSGVQVARVLAELAAVPRRLESARRDLRNPPRAWTDDAIQRAAADAALLEAVDDHGCDDDPAAQRELHEAAGRSQAALERFEAWLRGTLAPRSHAFPSWRPESLELFARTREGLGDYDLDRALRLAEAEATVQERRLGEISPLPTAPFVGWGAALTAADSEARALEAWLTTRGRQGLPYAELEPRARLRHVAPFPRVAFEGAPPDGWAAPLGELSLLEAEQLLSPTWLRLDATRAWLDALVFSGGAGAASEDPIRRVTASECTRAASLLYLERWLFEAGYFSESSDRSVEQAFGLRRLLEAQRAIVRIRLARREIDLEDAAELLYRRVGLPVVLARAEARVAGSSLLPPACGLWGERAILELREELARAGRPLAELHRALWAAGPRPLWALSEGVTGPATGTPAGSTD